MRCGIWDLLFYMKLYKKGNFILCWWESCTFSCDMRNRSSLGRRRWVPRRRETAFSWDLHVLKKKKKKMKTENLDVLLGVPVKAWICSKDIQPANEEQSQRQGTKARWKGQQVTQSLNVASVTQDSYFRTNAPRKCWLCFCALQYRRKRNG